MTENIDDEDDEYVVAEYVFRDSLEYGLFIDIVINKGTQPIETFGPFESEEERMAALKDMLETAESLGAINMPTRGH